MKRRAFLSTCLALPCVATLGGAERPRLICFGDSITLGTGASTPEHAYAALIAAALGLTLDNRSIGGSVLAEQLDRAILTADIHPPDVALLLTGYNDMRAGTELATYQAQLEQATRHLTQYGAQLYLGDCLRMTPAGYAAYGPRWNHGSDDSVVAFNQVIHAARGARIVAASHAYDPANVVADLVHPSDAGHRQIASAFLGVMWPRVYMSIALGA